MIRERASMVLMVRALSSEGRMTATILTALPVLAFVALFLVNLYHAQINPFWPLIPATIAGPEALNGPRMRLRTSIMCAGA